jgi:hypothetical protein
MEQSATHRTWQRLFSVKSPRSPIRSATVCPFVSFLFSDLRDGNDLFSKCTPHRQDFLKIPEDILSLNVDNVNIAAYNDESRQRKH